MTEKDIENLKETKSKMESFLYEMDMNKDQEQKFREFIASLIFSLTNHSDEIIEESKRLTGSCIGYLNEAKKYLNSCN